jgi:hypothetical protein
MSNRNLGPQFEDYNNPDEISKLPYGEDLSEALKIPHKFGASERDFDEYESSYNRGYEGE